MKVNELFREIGLSREDVERRVSNSKSPQEKAIWQSMMPADRLHLSEEKLADYFKRIQKEHGIKKLGGGAFSQVFQHPEFKNVVVKVYVQRDVKYAKYVKFCLSNQSNRYVPQIISQTKHKSPSGDKYNILFMQKMQKIRGNRALATLLGDILKMDDDEQDTLFDDLESIQFEEVFDQIDSAVSSGKSDADFKSLWSVIKSFGKKNFDLHPGNAMLVNGQLVITDPVAGEPGDDWVSDL